MAQCTVTYTLTSLDGQNDSTNIFTLNYRRSGRGNVTATGGLYSSDWRSANVGGTSGARTITLEQGLRYDFQFFEGQKLWNNCTCPSTSTADLQDLLVTSS